MIRLNLNTAAPKYIVSTLELIVSAFPIYKFNGLDVKIRAKLMDNHFEYNHALHCLNSRYLLNITVVN